MRSPNDSSADFLVEDMTPVADGAAAPARKRLKPGERRLQILQALAAMLEQPTADRVTTAALAARLEVSEAALYRHFASKAQMFEALIEFIEGSVFGLAQQISERETEPATRAARVVTMVLQFGERNPGMARVMVGDALAGENERLRQRMAQFFDKLEAALRQHLRPEVPIAAGDSLTPDADAQLAAAILTAYVSGRLQRFVRSGFRRSPTEQLDLVLRRLLYKA